MVPWEITRRVVTEFELLTGTRSRALRIIVYTLVVAFVCSVIALTDWVGIEGPSEVLIDGVAYGIDRIQEAWPE